VQLLKLGAAESAAANLTATFLLWDSDMIALRPVALSTPDGRLLRAVGGSRVKTYGGAYERLTGERLASAPDGSSFVTHQMGVEARHMRAMLAAFAASAPAAACAAQHAASRLPRWALGVLCALPADALHLGFSEYASYASWTAAHAAGSVVLAPQRQWTRHPLGSVWAVAAQRALHPRRRCCPTRRLLAATAAQGWLYTGFEARPLCLMACGLCSSALFSHRGG
jgi:hypothetical protein